jgi:hypothetical protein
MTPEDSKTRKCMPKLQGKKDGLALGRVFDGLTGGDNSEVRLLES